MSKVAIDIEARDKATRPLKNVQDAYERFKKRGMAGVTIGASAAVTAKAFSVVGSAIGATTDFLVDSVKAAADEERGIAQLNASLAANVKGWEGQTAAIEKGIKAGERMGFADDAVRASLARLVGATHDVGKAFEIMGTAQDLARFKGISLEEASTALIKVEGGQYRALKELGIVLREGATATEALAEVQKVAGGQAAAYADTLAGKTEILANRMDNLQETVGGLVVPALDDLASSTIGLGDAFDKMSNGSLQDQADGIFAIAEAANFFNPVGQLMAGTLEDQKKQADAMIASMEKAATVYDSNTEAMAGYREPVSKTAAATQRLADKSAAAAAKTQRLAEAAKRGADRLKDIEQAADDARDALFGASKTPKELELELEGARLEGKDLHDELAKLERKKPTRDVRQDIIDTKLAIIDNEKKVISLQGELVALGKVSLAKHENTIHRLGYGWGDAKDELDAYLRSLAKVPGVKIPSTVRVPNQVPDDFLAEGGPVTAGRPYVVGEKGIEWFVPQKDGTIIPNDVVRSVTSGQGMTAAQAGAAAGGNVFNFHFSAPVLTPGVMQQFADQVAPAITRWQQARGL